MKWNLQGRIVVSNFLILNKHEAENIWIRSSKSAFISLACASKKKKIAAKSKISRRWDCCADRFQVITNICYQDTIRLILFPYLKSSLPASFQHVLDRRKWFRRNLQVPLAKRSNSHEIIFLFVFFFFFKTTLTKIEAPKLKNLILLFIVMRYSSFFEL